MINQIIEKVAIGEKQDALNERLLKQCKVDYILNINEVEHNEEKRIAKKLGILYMWFPIPSEHTTSMKTFKEDLKAASKTLEELTKSNNHILIHCCAGIDRAPFIVALYLSNSQHISLSEAYQIIKQQRKHICEHYEWFDDTS